MEHKKLNELNDDKLNAVAGGIEPMLEVDELERYDREVLCTGCHKYVTPIWQDGACRCPRCGTPL